MLLSKTFGSIKGHGLLTVRLVEGNDEMYNDYHLSSLDSWLNNIVFASSTVTILESILSIKVENKLSYDSSNPLRILISSYSFANGYPAPLRTSANNLILMT